MSLIDPSTEYDKPLEYFLETLGNGRYNIRYGKSFTKIGSNRVFTIIDPFDPNLIVNALNSHEFS